MAIPAVEWSILIYIAAHNNLDQWGRRSLAQIMAVGSSARVKLSVLYDGGSGGMRAIAGEPGSRATRNCSPASIRVTRTPCLRLPDGPSPAARRSATA